MYTCRHCHTEFDCEFCPGCGVRRPVALIDQNPDIERMARGKAKSHAAKALPKTAALQENDTVSVEHEINAALTAPCDCMLEDMFGKQSVESLTYNPRPDDGLPLQWFRAYFSTGGSAEQAIRVIRYLIYGDARAAAQCSLSAYGRKSWFFLMLPQSVVITLLSVMTWLLTGGALIDLLERFSILLGAALLMLILLVCLLSALLGCGLKLTQVMSLVLTSTLQLAFLLPFACLFAWLIPSLLLPALFLCAFAVFATLYAGIEFAAMINNRRSLPAFVLIMLPEAILCTLLVKWLILV